jgi:hypothetical protein
MRLDVLDGAQSFNRFTLPHNENIVVPAKFISSQHPALI